MADDLTVGKLGREQNLGEGEGRYRGEEREHLTDGFATLRAMIRKYNEGYVCTVDAIHSS